MASLAAIMMGLGLAVWSENLDFPAYTSWGIDLTIAGFAGMIVSLFFFTLRSRTLSCRLIQEGYLYLEGAGVDFLRSLPRLTGERAGDGEN